ncbi:MAG: hypothetical protein LLF90_10410 [Methanomicrobiaceae archaeon]|nr:hypothetical protein [Methanomicrobiaceae archaeon]
MFDGILYVLTPGCTWHALPLKYGTLSPVLRYPLTAAREECVRRSPLTGPGPGMDFRGLIARTVRPLPGRSRLNPGLHRSWRPSPGNGRDTGRPGRPERFPSQVSSPRQTPSIHRCTRRSSRNSWFLESRGNLELRRRVQPAMPARFAGITGTGESGVLSR